MYTFANNYQTCKTTTVFLMSQKSHFSVLTGGSAPISETLVYRCHVLLHVWSAELVLYLVKVALDASGIFHVHLCHFYIHNNVQNKLHALTVSCRVVEWQTVLNKELELEYSEIVSSLLTISYSNLYSMLNYTDYVCAIGSTGIGVFGEGTGPVWLSGLRCGYLDKHLDECRGNQPQNNPCLHYRDASVICQGSCHSSIRQVTLSKPAVGGETIASKVFLMQQ